jgi:hypothetical protein
MVFINLYDTGYAFKGWRVRHEKPEIILYSFSM